MVISPCDYRVYGYVPEKIFTYFIHFQVFYYCYLIFSIVIVMDRNNEEGFFCGKCTRNVNNWQHALFCELCSVWYHRIYLKGTMSYMSQHTYRKHMKNGTSFDWICVSCDRYQGISPTVSY